MGRLCVAFAFAIAVLTASSVPASAAVLLTNGSGKLTGATGVTVNGTSYDVEFVDGICSDIFSGCDSSGDFAFNTETDALAGAQALLDLVFVGGFDDFPNTVGCGSSCSAFIPFAIESGSLSIAIAENCSVDGGPDCDNVSSDIIFGGFNSSLNPVAVYARFTAATAPVPEPATWSMMLLGFGAIGFALRTNGKRRLLRIG